MEICLADFDAKPIMLKLIDGNIYIDDELQPIKYVTEEELQAFVDEIEQIPFTDDPGYQALINAKRTKLIVSLLGRAVGDDCINLLTHILDHLHFHVLEYLGEDS